MGLGTATKLSQPGWPYASIMKAIIGVFIFPPFPRTSDLVYEEGGNTTTPKNVCIEGQVVLL